MELIKQLNPVWPKQWMVRTLFGLLKNKSQIKALIIEDFYFQVAILEGAQPAWLWKNWRFKNPHLRGFWNGGMWAATLLISRHVSILRYAILMATLALPALVGMKVRKILKKESP